MAAQSARTKFEFCRSLYKSNPSSRSAPPLEISAPVLRRVLAQTVFTSTHGLARGFVLLPLRQNALKEWDGQLGPGCLKL